MALSVGDRVTVKSSGEGVMVSGLIPGSRAIRVRYGDGTHGFVDINNLKKK